MEREGLMDKGRRQTRSRACGRITNTKDNEMPYRNLLLQKLLILYTCTYDKEFKCSYPKMRR